MNATGNFTPVQAWEEVLSGENRERLEALLPRYLQTVRWFGGKARTISSVQLINAMPLHGENSTAQIAIIQVNYDDSDPQAYVLPLNFTAGDRAEELRGDSPQAILAPLEAEGQSGVLYDATSDVEFAVALLDAISNEKSFAHPDGGINAWPTSAYGDVIGMDKEGVQPRVMRVQQSNTSIAYGDRAILKLFRRLEEGTSPDLEIGRFLGEKGFANTPPLAGALEYMVEGREPLTLGILQGFVANKGDAWEYTLDALNSYFEHGSQAGEGSVQAPAGAHLLEVANEELPEGVTAALGDYLAAARLLGRRTAEMHLALASDDNNPAFAPEPFISEYLHSLYSSVKGLVENASHLLQGRLGRLPEGVKADAQRVLDSREGIMAGFQPLLEHSLQATRTRCHGDYHLGQVLYTGDDFFIIDFEGEPVRSLRERRLKHSPLKDVAGMLRSFHYAAYAALFDRTANGVEGQDAARLEALADAWHRWVGAAYLKEYLSVASAGNFLPQKPGDLRTLLDIYLLEKAVYELIYELNNRPDWIRIPLQGVRQLIP